MKIRVLVQEYLGSKRAGVPKIGRTRSFTFNTNKLLEQVKRDLAGFLGAEVRKVGRPKNGRKP